MNLTHDQEFQRQILAHPAYRPVGADPLWRVIAILGWLTVLLLTMSLSSCADTLVIGLNGQRASSPVRSGAFPNSFGMPAPDEMKPPALGNDDRSFPPRSCHLNIINPPARDCGTGGRSGAGGAFQ